MAKRLDKDIIDISTLEIIKPIILKHHKKVIDTGKEMGWNDRCLFDIKNKLGYKFNNYQLRSAVRRLDLDDIETIRFKQMYYFDQFYSLYFGKFEKHIDTVPFINSWEIQLFYYAYKYDSGLPLKCASKWFICLSFHKYLFGTNDYIDDKIILSIGKFLKRNKFEYKIFCKSNLKKIYELIKNDGVDNDERSFNYNYDYYLKCPYCENNMIPRRNQYDRNDLTMETDHILAKTKGGSDDISNKTLCCRKCNRLKSNKFTKEQLLRSVKL